MAKAGQRKCMSCGEFFIPDHRKGERQRYCCAANCRRASKAASQAAWLARPPNNDYFCGPVHVARVQAWRAAHPGYSRGRGRPSRALQDLLTPQVTDSIEECADRVEPVEAPVALALQDLLNTESPLLAVLQFAGKAPTALCPVIMVNGKRLHALAHYAAPLPGRAEEDRQRQ
ncbi:hypothetical protein [Roseateles saccharophilus]|uniref:Uncharacterized protein n=1 Tax=Roseateles saccharophilus TaxID=304 RepID=A0A4R3U4G6_ROSSA|nr:hypothetical protein [Roseateles saccharophilus]MDG0836171.1 hypothetical protein [Roseateles saccharophilus]TCU81740.1 hypothetical protein EV671_10727 [Roseateles saccharophilus]